MALQQSFNRQQLQLAALLRVYLYIAVFSHVATDGFEAGSTACACMQHQHLDSDCRMSTWTVVIKHRGLFNIWPN
jgi:hypothetical protein